MDTPSQSTGFLIDPLLAKQLCFVSVALSGSRAYQYPQREVSTADWDFVGVVERKDDLLNLVRHRREVLCDMIGIVQPEDFPWEIIEETHEGNNNCNGQESGWDVVRFSGWAHDGSKRSIKLWSEEHIRTIAADPEVCRFGVLSAKIVRYTRNHHPRIGNRIFVYQPLRIAENLSVLVDVDFLAGKDDPTAVSLGVTCDLLLSSYALFEQFPDSMRSLKGALMRKWNDITDQSDLASLIPLFHGYGRFDTKTIHRLQIELITKNPSSSSSPPGSPDESHSGGSSVTSEFKMDEEVEDYGVVSFLPIKEKEKLWSLQHEHPVSTFPRPPPGYPHADLEFRPVTEKYYPSSFTSNSQGSFGEIRVRAAGSESGWSPVFVKKGRYINDELLAFPTVQEHFPPECLQQLVTVDHDAQMLFYRLFDGKTLNQIRLDYYLEGRSFLTDKHEYRKGRNFLDTVNWFLDLELRRAELVLNSYIKTIDVNPDPTSCREQKIHRFYHARLRSDSRFLEFYSERCLEVLRLPCLHSNQDFTTSDFLNTPLIINGVTYPPLRHHFDRATDILDPNRQGGLSDLPVAFGLGDGHGGNLMVTEDLKGGAARSIYIDYEVSGSHCPFLDMAKSIYNDAFFNVLYADLLCDDATKSLPTNNKSGASVSWNIQPEFIDINYNLQLDTIGKTVAITKFEYVLRPIFDLVNQYDTQKANLSVDVLSSALFTCALLTRCFRERADIFFLNLAIGVRLATELNEVLFETFEWVGLPAGRNPGISDDSTEGMQLQLLSLPEETQYLSSQFAKDLNMDFFAFLFSSNLQPDDVFLKRADETYQLQQWFSQKGQESQGTIIRRISAARRAGMMISPHTCIRESIFAEPRIDHHFAYGDILAEFELDTSRLLVDVGCCMGTDIRKLVLDGYSPENILGLDIENRYFNVGRTLYNEDLNASKLRFRQADLVDPNFAMKHPELGNRFHFVHSANVIHLFGIAKQEIFFRNLVHLVAPGGTIWGRQVGLTEQFEKGYRQPEGKGARFTINEFRDLALRAGNWDEQEARYEAQLVKYDEIRAQRQDKAWVLQWSVKVPVAKEKGKGNGVEVSVGFIEEEN